MKAFFATLAITACVTAGLAAASTAVADPGPGVPTIPTGTPTPTPTPTEEPTEPVNSRNHWCC